MLRAFCRLTFVLVLLVVAGCGDDDMGDAGPTDMGPRDLGADTMVPDAGGDTDVPDPDAGDASDDERAAAAARDAAGAELLDMRLWIALADSLFDFDPTIDPALTPEQNATRIQARVMAVAPCAMVSVAGAVVTLDFGAPPGCAIPMTGLVVSGRVTATLSKTGAETTVTVEATGIVVNGRTLSGTVVFRTTDGSTFEVSKTTGDTTFMLTITGGMARFTASGTITMNRMPPTTLTLNGVVWQRGACYPSAGSITISYALPRTVTQTITFAATTPMTGVATLSYGGREMPFTLPAYGGCPQSCGDRYVVVPEQCDDGNTMAGDGCSSMCTRESMPTSENCDVAGDEDGDGAADCADTECAGTPTCMTEPETLYLIAGDSLVSIDLATAAYSLIGSTGMPVNAFLGMTWDPGAGVARGWVYNADFTDPRLSTIDLCTGAVTTGPRVRIGETPVGYAEGMAVDRATGILYASVSADPAVDYISETFGALDATTGAVTPIGTAPDLDALVFADTPLAMDGSASFTQFFAIATATGATTPVAGFAAQISGIAYDRSSDRLFGYVGRDLVEIDLDAPSLTVIGTFYTEAEFGGVIPAGLFFAPAPTCPAM